jgi:hypothetical protein
MLGYKAVWMGKPKPLAVSEVAVSEQFSEELKEGGTKVRPRKPLVIRELLITEVAITEHDCISFF